MIYSYNLTADKPASITVIAVDDDVASPPT
jgi:hypothetical protein